MNIMKLSSYSFFDINNINFLNVCFFLAVLFIYLYIYRILRPKNNLENFSNKESFELMVNENIYDNEYTDMYDNLHDVKKRCSNELVQITKITQPNNKSVILDVGSGTGYKVNELNEAGYKTYGIETSDSMISYCKKLYPSIHIEKNTVLDPMAFDKSTFTHILCTYFTIYELKDKKQFFRNCYFWLQPNGYLVLHLVDRNKMTKLIPHDTNVEEFNSSSNKTLENITVFNDFKYKGLLKIPTNESDNQVELIETFTNHETNSIRQNQLVYNMESIETILNYASQAGFIFHSKVNMTNMNEDNQQYLFFFERPL